MEPPADPFVLARIAQMHAERQAAEAQFGHFGPQTAPYSPPPERPKPVPWGSMISPIDDDEMSFRVATLASIPRRPGQVVVRERERFERVGVRRRKVKITEASYDARAHPIGSFSWQDRERGPRTGLIVGIFARDNDPGDFESFDTIGRWPLAAGRFFYYRFGNREHVGHFFEARPSSVESIELAAFGVMTDLLTLVGPVVPTDEARSGLLSQMTQQMWENAGNAPEKPLLEWQCPEDGGAVGQCWTGVRACCTCHAVWKASA